MNSSAQSHRNRYPYTQDSLIRLQIIPIILTHPLPISSQSQRADIFTTKLSKSKSKIRVSSILTLSPTSDK